jgi:hypothetical protein
VPPGSLASIAKPQLPEFPTQHDKLDRAISAPPHISVAPLVIDDKNEVSTSSLTIQITPASSFKTMR